MTLIAAFIAALLNHPAWAAGLIAVHWTLRWSRWAWRRSEERRDAGYVHPLGR